MVQAFVTTNGESYNGDITGTFATRGRKEQNKIRINSRCAAAGAPPRPRCCEQKAQCARRIRTYPAYRLPIS